MNAEDIAKIVNSLAWMAWPTVVVGLTIYFQSSLRLVLNRLSQSLAIRTIKLNVLGIEIDLTPEQAERALDELLRDIADTIADLPPPTVTVFEQIQTADGRLTVIQIMPKFERENDDHKRLRTLRDRKLVRPFEGGRWTANTHPVVTRFGQLFWRLRSSLPTDKKS